MGKFIYIFLGMLCFVALLVSYFQMLTSITLQVPFFTKWVMLDEFMLYVILLAVSSGVFITLGINGFMSSSTINDEFDL